jgi:hypothetical protein
MEMDNMTDTVITSEVKLGISPEGGGSGQPVVPAVDLSKKPEPTAAEVAAKAVADKAAADKAAADAAAAAATTPAPDNAALLKERENWQAAYVELEDPAGQAAINMLKAKGVSPVEANAVFSKAMESGKLEDIDWKLLSTKMSADEVVLLKSGIEKYHADTYQKTAATTKAVFDLMGGQSNWEVVRAWAQNAEKTDAAIKTKVDSIRKSLELGGWSAEAAARELKTMYEAAPGTKGLGTSTLTNGDTVSTASLGGPLTKEQYTTQLKAAHAANQPPSVTNALRERRKLGMAQGI